MADAPRPPERSGTGLEVADATVRFGDLTAVDDVSLQVAGAETLAILGPSGCGKSTLLRAVVGLEELTSGTVRFDGADMAGVPVHRRGFGLMFQDGQLFEHLTVGGNVAYGPRRRGVDRAEAIARVERLLTLVGLDGYAARRPATLSGGERQRVALARALAAEPRLLLLDEPLSALDASLRGRLAADLRRILATTETPALLVTHDHEEAFAVADRVALMRAGRIVQTGTPREVWAHPVDAEAALFLGYSRVLEAREAEALRAAYPSALGASAGQGRDTAIALRQNALRVGDGPLEAEVITVAPALDELRLAVRLVDGTELDAVAGLVEPVEVGQHVRLVLDESAVARLP
ncbi:MAG: ABC transporter ATP-binding protein [Micrococcales bacterium]|nr:ABC transporter ATP-binding protein [Micrococcales bacterium]